MRTVDLLVTQTTDPRLLEARELILQGDAPSILAAQDLLREVEENPTVHNDPPSTEHCWDGTAWVLPSEHEIRMLDEMLEKQVIDKKEYTRQIAAAKKRLAEEQKRAKT
jgi:hypothetical protein